MSTLSYQVDSLRLMARLVRDYDYKEISRILREAADTIESLRDKLQPVPAELDYIEDKSRWHELFGTPERAAEYFATQCFGSNGGMCYYCPFDDCDERLRNMGAYPSVHDKLFEWLRGDA